MSARFGVYFRADRLPSHARWQGAIYAAGFRVALMPTVVAEYRGMLPVKTGGTEYDSGFEFDIKPILAGMERLDALLRGLEPFTASDRPFLAGFDRFAFFSCNAREWPAAVCAAAGFAKASGGVFKDPYGEFILELEEVVAYARQESQKAEL